MLINIHKLVKELEKNHFSLKSDTRNKFGYGKREWIREDIYSEDAPSITYQVDITITMNEPKKRQVNKNGKSK